MFQKIKDYFEKRRETRRDNILLDLHIDPKFNIDKFIKEFKPTDVSIFEHINPSRFWLIYHYMKLRNIRFEKKEVLLAFIKCYNSTKIINPTTHLDILYDAMIQGVNLKLLNIRPDEIYKVLNSFNGGINKQPCIDFIIRYKYTNLSDLDKFKLINYSKKELDTKTTKQLFYTFNHYNKINKSLLLDYLLEH